MYMPRFLVTQEVYDAASPGERQKYNYVVDERIHIIPESFCAPKDTALSMGSSDGRPSHLSD